MDCHQAESFVSVLYDGEEVPQEFAAHIDQCPHCRERLASYSRMGAELRLLASRMSADSVLPARLRERVERPQQSRRFAFFGSHVLVPRLALAMLVLALLSVSTGLVIVRAQVVNRPLWFQYELTVSNPNSPDKHMDVQHILQAGHDDGVLIWKPQDIIVGAVVSASSIEEGKVELSVKTRRYSEADPNKFHFKEQLSAEKAQRFEYVPGQVLEIPVEGGGTLYLHGQVADHQPKIAWGMPAEPRADQLVLSSFVVLDGKNVVSEMIGGNAFTEAPNHVIDVYSSGWGRLSLASHPFPGAVKAKSEWGRIDMEFNGKKFVLISASPITGGDQPSTVWVAFDPSFTPPNPVSNYLAVRNAALSAP